MIKVKYGEGDIELNLNENDFSRILKPVEHINQYNDNEMFLNSINNPIESKNIQTLLEKRIFKKVALIVEDKTRSNPEYPFILKYFIDLFKHYTNSKIFLIIAYGTHEKHTLQENENLYGRENLGKVTLIDHNPFDNTLLSIVGKMKSGMHLKINKYVAEADFIITFGSVAPHAFAGFTGGRKAILPGISSYENINFNHSKVCLKNTDLGLIDNNPISLEMSEAAQLVTVDYTVQIVRNNKNNLAGIFSGNLNAAFNKAVEFCKKINKINITSKADLVLISCGGHPKDKTLYQTQRTVSTACKLVKTSGKIIVFGKFNNGIGNSDLFECLKKPENEVMQMNQSDIKVGIHSGYLFKRSLSNFNISFYTDLNNDTSNLINISKIDKEKIVRITKKLSEKNKIVYFVPNGSILLV